jgi:hypothetical protein
VIELAAVVGRAFTYGVLAHATDLSEDVLVAALDECWRKRIIREQGEDAYDFSHDKLREAAYAGLSRTRRRWLHGRVAQALEHVYAADLERAASAIAGHFEAAGQPAQAIAYYDRAAALARRVYANDDALTALERAIGLLAALPDEVARCGLAAHLEEERGDLREPLTQHGLARDAYTAALACAPEADRITRARLHRKIGKALEDEQAPYEHVCTQYEAAEALLGTPDRDDAGADWWKEWCQIQLESVTLLYWFRRPDEMAERIGRVRPFIERHGTPAQHAELLRCLHRQLNLSNRFSKSDTALVYARAALEALPQSVSPELRASHQLQFGFNLLWHGDPAQAAAELQVALDMAEQIGDLLLQVCCLGHLTMAYRRQGRVAEVERSARRGLAVAEAAGMLDYIGAHRANLAWVAWQGGDLAKADQLARAAIEGWRLFGWPYMHYWQALWPQIGVALAQDRPADAVSHARQFHTPNQLALPQAIEEPLAAALAAWDAGQPDEARQLLQRALDLAQQMNFS